MFITKPAKYIYTATFHSLLVFRQSLTLLQVNTIEQKENCKYLNLFKYKHLNLLKNLFRLHNVRV